MDQKGANMPELSSYVNIATFIGPLKHSFQLQNIYKFGSTITQSKTLNLQTPIRYIRSAEQYHSVLKFTTQLCVIKEASLSVKTDETQGIHYALNS